MNVLFRATASDVVCNDVYRPDPTPDVLAVIIGENQEPEADVVRAEDLDGVEVDVRPEIMDDSGVATIGADMDTMRVFVTAGGRLFHRGGRPLLPPRSELLRPHDRRAAVEEHVGRGLGPAGFGLSVRLQRRDGRDPGRRLPVLPACL
ncbi:MAG: hypothetical protein MZV65_29030 [Chromatiales bacterium]|nr:hypothetical protein [Chromatiales bacterium]